MHDDAVDLYMTDIAQGKKALLLAGSNEEAARLARLVRERRIERGQIGGQARGHAPGRQPGRGR